MILRKSPRVSEHGDPTPVALIIILAIRAISSSNTNSYQFTYKIACGELPQNIYF